MIAESADEEVALPEPGRVGDARPDSKFGDLATNAASQEAVANQPQELQRDADAALGTSSSDENSRPGAEAVEPEQDGEVNTAVAADSGPDMNAATTGAGNDDSKLVDDLAARGIMPSVAIKLLAALPPERRAAVAAYIEYWDSLKEKKDVGAGLLYNFIRSGDPLPAGFKTAQQQQDENVAEERRVRRQRAHNLLQTAYEKYARDATKRFIEEEFPKDVFARRVEDAKAQYAGSGTMFEKPEIAAQMARHSVWAEVAKEAPICTFEDFCAREGALILAEEGLDSADAEIEQLTSTSSIA